MKRLLFQLVAVMSLGLIGTTAPAAIMQVGDIELTGSWNVHFKASWEPTHRVDMFAITTENDLLFESPTFPSISDGWRSEPTADPGHHGVAQGPTAHEVDFTAHFEGAPRIGDKFHFSAYHEGEDRSFDDYDVILNDRDGDGKGDTYEGTPSDQHCGRSDHRVVPEPASLLVWSAIGGLGIVGARRRRRRAA